MLKHRFSIGTLLFGLKANPGSKCDYSNDDGKCDTYQDHNYLGKRGSHAGLWPENKRCCNLKTNDELLYTIFSIPYSKGSLRGAFS